MFMNVCMNAVYMTHHGVAHGQTWDIVRHLCVCLSHFRRRRRLHEKADVVELLVEVVVVLAGVVIVVGSRYCA
jgi:hypothetical protein